MDFRLPQNSEVLATPSAGPWEWAVDTNEVLTRELTGPVGEVGTSDDTVLRVHRPIDVWGVVVTGAGHRRRHGTGPVPARRPSPDDRPSR